MKSISFLTIFIIFGISKAATGHLCGDWEPFKDEGCYKVSKVGQQSFENAEKTCQKEGATLITIHSKEEQEFLTNFLFKKSKIVDNVWIGAKLVGSKFKWNDKSELMFKNWLTGSPRNLDGYCIQMQSDISSVGKWTDEPCKRENLVVCQKRPVWSAMMLEEMVIEMKHSMQMLSQNVLETQTNLKKTAINFAKFGDKIDKIQPVPLGFTYIQLPKDKSAKEIWPTMKWTDVSSEYAGVFFRVEGGNAQAFGQKQADNAPRLTGVKYEAVNEGSDQVEMKLGEWSSWCKTAPYVYTNEFRANSYQMSAGEVRPVNMATRVWKRTG